LIFDSRHLLELSRTAWASFSYCFLINFLLKIVDFRVPAPAGGFPNGLGELFLLFSD